MRRSLGGWLAELRRRRVLRVAGVYLVCAWVGVQVADTTFPHLHLPAWTITAVIIVAVVGFPVALALGHAPGLAGAHDTAWSRPPPEPEHG